MFVEPGCSHLAWLCGMSVPFLLCVCGCVHVCLHTHMCARRGRVYFFQVLQQVIPLSHLLLL